MSAVRKQTIPNKLYFRIGEVSDIIGVKPYVLRYWETEFSDVRPTKSKSGQRLYKRRDVELLMQVKTLLYEERYTIDGAKQKLRENTRGSRAESRASMPVDSQQLELPDTAVKAGNGHHADAEPAPSHNSGTGGNGGTLETLETNLRERRTGGASERRLLLRIRHDLQQVLQELSS